MKGEPTTPPRRMTAAEALALTGDDLDALAAGGVHRLVVDGALPADDHDAGTLDTLRLLRRVEVAGLRLTWQATGDGLVRADLFTHLQAPAGPQGWARAWRDAYDRGAHYVRRGPGMFQVVHWRGARQRITLLDDPAEVSRFAEILKATDDPDATLEPGDPRVDAELVRAAVVAVVADRPLVPAVRMARWPVPVWSR